MVRDDLAWERWEKQFHEINPNPICCNQLMQCYQADTVGLYYRCLECKKKIFTAYKHEDYRDSEGRIQLRKKRITLDVYVSSK